LETRGKLAAAPTGTLLPRSRRTFRTSALCALAIIVFLAVPAVALGGNGNDDAPAAANDAQSGTTASSDVSDASANASSSDPAPSTQSTPVQTAAVTPDASPQSNGGNNGNGNGNGNGNANGNANANGNSPTIVPEPDKAPPVQANASNGNANGHNDPPGNSGNAPGQNDSPGNSGSAPGLSDSPGNSDHAANANANANSSQDKPKNVNVDVKVGQPGDNGAVAQGNNSTAAAAAGASGGSSGAGAAQQTAAGTGDSSSSDAGPNGTAALAPSQADSTGGETIPVANSPPGNATASDPAATGCAGTATTASTGDSSPTVLNTSPSASHVNGGCSGSQTTPDSAQNLPSNGQATGVTGSSTTDSAPTGAQATGVTPDYTSSNGQIAITLPADDPAADDTTGDSGSVTVEPDPGTDETADPGPVVTVVAPAPVGSSSANTAGATANSTQVEPANVNIGVRVLSPGSNGPVAQENSSSAAAAAGADGANASATPQANSTQVDPHNINVSIRVGSPGDDAPISQVNESTASAAPVDPAAIQPVTVRLPEENPNSAADSDNASSIIQDLSQCTEESNCAATPAAGASATPGSVVAPDHSNASATQESPSNVSVSVRVASPGKDGTVSQLNAADADAAATVVTKTDPDNLVVAISIPGDPSEVKIPTDPNTPWVWAWNWTTGAAPTSPDGTPISTADWNWNWTDGVTPAATPPADVPPPTPGHWTWTWVWTRGDGWTTTLTYDRPCDCTWSWVWTWNWAAPSAATSAVDAKPEDIPAPPQDPQISQTNTSSATAAALTMFDGEQTTVTATDGDPWLATHYQGISSDQSAVATADAAQTRARNTSFVTAGRLEKLTQLNQAAAGASAGAFDTAVQRIEQSQAGTDDAALHALDAAQVIATVQSATAVSQTAQADAWNLNEIWSLVAGNQAVIGAVTQKNAAVTGAYAAVQSETSQTIGQSQTGGGAEQLATALQAALVTQNNTATAQVAQGTVINRTSIQIPWNGLWNPAITQSNVMSAVSLSTSQSGISQTIVQEQSGDIEWDAHAVQLAEVTQGGKALAGAEQIGRENLAGWNGVVASDAAAGGSGYASQSTAASGTAASADGGLITGTPPVLPIAGVLGGHVSSFSFSSGFAVLKRTPWAALLAGTSSATPPAAAPAVSGSATSGTEQYRHLLLALLGAMSSTLGVFFGTTPVAGLLALFMIAALGVGRLQYTAPALGRSADFARRERPG
jgi:hypothetical protein